MRHPPTRLGQLLLALGLSFVSLTAAAQDWGATFTPASLAEHFPQSTRFLVVAAGTDSGAAGAALVEGLRAAGFPLVMTAESLGDVTQLDDAAILERAAALPGDAVLIERVFPGATAEAPSVVIVAYDRAGRARGSLHAVAGSLLASEPLAPKPAAPVVARPVAPPRGRDAKLEAQLRYEREFVWFGYRHISDIGAGAAQYARRPVIGVQRKRLDWDEFYEAVERPDLARKFRRNWRLKKLFSVGGAGLLAGGIGMALVTGSCNDHEELYEDWQMDTMVAPACRPLAIGTGALLGVGGGLIVAAVIMHKQPVSREEARHLAEEHNARLRKNYGLPEHITKSGVSAVARKRELSLSLAPAVRRGGGSLSAALRF